MLSVSVASSITAGIPHNEANINLSALPDLPDADFGTSLHFPKRNNILHGLPCVMVAIKAMREIALRHFIGDDLPLTAWSRDDCSGVIFSVGPPRGSQKVTVRFTLWTILAAIRDYLTTQRYKSAWFTGECQRIPVAVSYFERASPPELHAGKGYDTSGFQLLQPSVVTPAPNISQGLSFGFDVMSAGVGEKADDRLDAKIDFVEQSTDRRDLF